MFQLMSRVVCTTSGFVYPSYASYKAIKSNDPQKLETWLMYWAVMGSVMALENTVEWVVAWFPFYYEMKTLVILWLTLPQIQGSTYIYVAHLHPFLLEHEKDIDAALADAKVHAKRVGLEWLNKAIRRTRELVVGTLAPQLLQEQLQEGHHPPSNMQHPSTLNDPASGTTYQLYSMASNALRAYGPAAVAAGNALLHPMNGRTSSVRASPNTTMGTRAEQMRSLGVDADRPVPSARAGGVFDDRIRSDSFASGRSGSLTKAQARARRAELEAQIADLEQLNHSDASTPSSSGKESSGSGARLDYQPRTVYNHRSVSAGSYPTSLSMVGGGSGSGGGRIPSSGDLSGSKRIERSFIRDGFEEIGKDELGGYLVKGGGPALPSDKPSKRHSSASASSSWWWWSSGTEVNPAASLAPVPATTSASTLSSVTISQPDKKLD